jgi:phosphoserine phosphatase
MKNSVLTLEEKKAKKAAYNKAYAAKKKEKETCQDWMNLDKFEKSFEHKVRLYKNLKLEKTNSYCASPGTNLVFEKIKTEDNKIVFRVRRTGRRTFFTTSAHLIPQEV